MTHNDKSAIIGIMDINHVIENKDGELIVRDYAGPFIYLLYNKEELVYIGKSLNVIYRIAAHITRVETDMDFDRAVMKRVPALELDGIEKQLIIKNKPKYNISYVVNPTRVHTRRETPIRLDMSRDFIDTLRHDWGNTRADLLIKYITTDMIDKDDLPHRPQILADYKRLKRAIKLKMKGKTYKPQ